MPFLPLSSCENEARTLRLLATHCREVESGYPTTLEVRGRRSPPPPQQQRTLTALPSLVACGESRRTARF